MTRRATILAACLVATGACVPADGGPEGQPLLTDVTIYLDGPLLRRGGTVFVVPNEVSQADWKAEPSLPNPARDDPRLDVRVPIGPDDRRLSVVLSAPLGVVRFDALEGGANRFRFLPVPDSGVAPEQQGSVLVSVGSAYDYHPETGEERFVPSTQTFAILTPGADEEAAKRASRSYAVPIRLGFLEERYPCERFEGALACDATAINEAASE